MADESESKSPGGGVLAARQREILDYARQHGEVQVEPLSELFNVTPQTIRRDLNLLCDLHLLRRVHGGAISHDGVANMRYNARRNLMATEKAAIAAMAAELIPDDSSIFVNIGTTTEQVAAHLTAHRGLLVITNNINVVSTLRESETCQIMTAGGTVRPEDGGIIGDATVEYISQFKVDYAVIGVSCIEPDGALLDFDPLEVRVAKAIIQNSREVILVADSMKFQRNAPVRIGNIAELDYLVTDETPDAEFMDYCKHHGVRVLVTSDNKTN